MGLNITRFVKEDIWLLHESRLPPANALLIKSLKILILSIQGFSRDLCPLRASALTLYSLLSIVPVIAMLFGVAKGFGLEKMLEQRLLEQVPAQETTVLQLIHFAQNLLTHTKGEVIAGFGIVVLFWSVINVIGDIEESFNAIWKISKGRSIGRKFSDYLSLMLLAPVLLITAGSITVFLKTQITWLIGVIALPELGAWLAIQALSLLPLLLMTSLFAFTFIFMPNHEIDYKAGIIAGIAAGLLYHLAQWTYLSLQIGVSTYNAIYGSFAALPLFVAWLQICWMIVLWGCEVAFFLQNYPSYQHNNRYSGLSFSLQKVIALQITHLLIKNFSHMNKPLTAAEIAARLVIPLAVIQPILATLTTSRVIIEFKNKGEINEVYQPAVDINKLTIAYVVNALEQCGQNHLPDINQECLFMNVLNDFRNLMEASEQNRLLKDIVR